MRRVLLVRAGIDNELVDDFLTSSAAFVGWKKLDDLSGASASRIDELLLDRYPECRTQAGAPRKHYREILAVACEAKKGDLVVTPHRATRMLIVGSVNGPYYYSPDSTVASGGEPYRHAIPVKWEYAISRDEFSRSALADFDQRGKTAFWLKPETAGEIEAAPRVPIGTRHVGSASGRSSSVATGRRVRVGKSTRERPKAKQTKTAPVQNKATSPGCCGCGTALLAASGAGASVLLWAVLGILL